MKKNYGLFIGFVVVVLAVVGYCIFYVFGNVGAESYTFNKDGYALYSTEKNNYKAESYSFTNGSTYSYKKSNSKITFNSTENGNVSIDDSTVVHYTDNSLLVLKNVVGLDLTTINNDIIFYYNIYKNTNINYDNGGYSITSFTGEKINFKNVLIRVSDNKYLFVSDSIRATVGKDEVIDFGNYAYIEYTDGNVVAIYNNTKTHQSISDDISLVSGDITINIADKTIAKEGEKYITLSNLVIDSNANIDLIPQEIIELPGINNPNIENGTGGSAGNTGGVGNEVVGGDTTEKPSGSDNNINQEVVEDENKKIKQPVFKVVNMVVSAIKLDAELEIVDEDSLIVSAIDISVVDNSSLRVVYESSIPAGDTSAFISTAGLTPDTEYTIYAKTTYKIDDLEYTRSFVNKIFRTESLGITFDKSYATSNLISVIVKKKNYSEVTSATLSIYDEKGGKLTYKGVDFSNSDEVEIIFDGLDKNTKYNLVLHDILCDGVVVEEGYSEEKRMMTLKEAPSVGDLQFQINKRSSKFDLSVKSVSDPDYGIVEYRYEVFDVRQDMSKELPILTVETNKLETVSVNVDESKLFRGSAYTYRLVVVFNDNDKIIEYTKELGSTMQMDGVKFPTVRFDETYVTWEQINGTIIVDDPNHTIVGDSYRVVYKNSVDVYTTNTIISSTSEETIPIAINDLRKNETYTFQVYAKIDLKDNNDPIDEAYIGSVIVKTGNPNTMVANYEAIPNFSSAFSINLQLDDKDNEDSTLEASTISEMTLTLYQGSSTKGAIEVYRKVVDVNEADYISTIKDSFYDSIALINPAFFDTVNSDFTEKTYTLEVSKVYDYTKYKNEIPIDNNTFTFTVNSYVPDLPDQDANPVNVTKILNKNATLFGLEYDDKLEPNTVIGYSVISNYMNEANNATRMVYHVWAYNHLTNSYEIIMDKYLDYDEEGNISNVVFPIGYGTEKSVFDSDMLRRGNEYYFSYEVYLDIDGDGQEDALYPKVIDENVILRSTSQFPDKQTPVYQLYPSSSTANSASWKYRIYDIDYCLDSNNLYGFVANNSESSSSPAIHVGNDDYHVITFNNLTSDTFYSIKANERKIKSKDAKYNTLSTQYLSTIVNRLDLSYSVEVSSNTLIIRMDDYENKSDIIDSIASVDVTITPVKGNDIQPRVLTGVLLDNGVAFINLLELSEFLNKEFKVDLKIYFDSGNAGFDVTSNYKALQIVSIEGNGNYLSVENNAMTQNSVITRSEFITEFDPMALLLSVTDKLTNNIKLPITITERGVIYNKNNITFKELIEQELPSDNNVASFDLLVPNISLLNNDSKLNIISLLTEVELTAKLDIIDGIVLKENLIYIDLFETDENGTSAIYKQTYQKTPDMFEKTIVLDGLNPQTNYYINFYTYIYNSVSGNYDKYYLYDEDQKLLGANYNFHTLSDVGIDNIKTSFVIDSYESKKIKFNYTLESIYGYDHIEYSLFEFVNEEFVPVEIDIPQASIFFNNMGFEINANPGNVYEFSYGKTYKIVISPIGSYISNGEEKEVDLGTKEHVFTLDEFIEPYVGISASKTDQSIFFRVSIEDSSKIINKGVYSVKLMDSGYNTIATLNNISANTINKRFDFDASEYGLQDNETYIFVVSFDADYDNSNNDFKNVTKTKSIKYGNTVNIGSLTASRNKDDKYMLDIIFADSYMLTSIDKITYTVSSTTISYFSTGTTDFKLTYNPDGDLYVYKMKVDENDNFTSGNVYTITINFYSKNNLVEQAEISYYYGGE